jgi:predicted nuclease of predicted toxin-antitoxin system
VTRFLIDNQLPAALARWLQARGHQAEHVLALGMGQTADALIWQHAARTGAVIVTKDEDFAQLTILRPEGVRVVWLRVGNCRTAVLLAVFERLWPEIVRQLDAGAGLIEVY